jgi:hypothetical protein
MRRPDERPVPPGFTRLVILIPDELADQLDELTRRKPCPSKLVPWLRRDTVLEALRFWVLWCNRRDGMGQ